MHKIILPELGEGIEKAEVVVWHAKEGGTVRKDDDILELVTDKATFNVPSPADGVLKRILVRAGQEAPVGAVLGEIS